MPCHGSAPKTMARRFGIGTGGTRRPTAATMAQRIYLRFRQLANRDRPKCKRFYIIARCRFVVDFFSCFWFLVFVSLPLCSAPPRCRFRRWVLVVFVAWQSNGGAPLER